MKIKQNLDWDSDFFGFKTASLLASPTKEVLEQLFNTDITLAYFFSEKPTELIENTYFEGKLVDEKTVFLKKILAKRNFNDNIISYQESYVSDQLLTLAVASGAYSRFNVDQKIGYDKFTKLYQIWIERSVSREIAKEVLVYKIDGIIAGFVTIGEKSNRADIGIIAVDEQFRGKGVGKSLMFAAENWAIENGFTDLQVVTQGQNLPACGLYRSSGFKIETIHHFYHFWRK